MDVMDYLTLYKESLKVHIFATAHVWYSRRRVFLQ